ncbi:DUF2059 domain-containing protein [Salinisphaera sp.]|uniref:DUF2059 domain-containing protein n=1 Tax=Salinisphaera sp. TaxID=1914330 RepID=UPI002D78D00E|nr:DUF2059 domain-containing protein [Salinisphaera sp.]HET7314448.1 DUF2059 domain-containing protein [Salinisphaera sp.]
MTTWAPHRRRNRRERLNRAGTPALIPGLISGLALALVVSLAASGAAWAASSSAPGDDGSYAVEPANAADIDRSKEQLIRTLVNLTDTPQVQALFSQELINRVSGAISMFGPALKPRTMGVIQRQTRAVVSEHIENGDALYSVLAPVYEKHFNLIELSQLVQFYRSPLGQKLVATSPELMAETMDLGARWGLSLVPEIVQRVQTRLQDQTPTAGGAPP